MRKIFGKICPPCIRLETHVSPHWRAVVDRKYGCCPLPAIFAGCLQAWPPNHLADKMGTKNNSQSVIPVLYSKQGSFFQSHVCPYYIWHTHVCKYYVCRLLTATQFRNHLKPDTGLDVSAAQCNYCICICRLLTSTPFRNHLKPGAGLDVSAAQCNYCICMLSPYLHFPFCNHLKPGAGLEVYVAQCNYCACMSSPYLHPVLQSLDARRWVGRLGSTVQLLYLYVVSLPPPRSATT